MATGGTMHPYTPPPCVGSPDATDTPPVDANLADTCATVATMCCLSTQARAAYVVLIAGAAAVQIAQAGTDARTHTGTMLAPLLQDRRLRTCSTPFLIDDILQSSWTRHFPAGHPLPANLVLSPIRIEGRAAGLLCLTGIPTPHADPVMRIAAGCSRLIADALSCSKLRDAVTRLHLSAGLLSICAACKKIRDDNGRWHEIEQYIRHHAGTEFSHGLCPHCARILYPDLAARGLTPPAA